MSERASERSGTDVDRFIAEAEKPSTVDFLRSDEPITLSSFDANCAAAIERLDEPDVDTVESDEDDGCEGCPRRAGFNCCSVRELGADVDELSCRS